MLIAIIVTMGPTVAYKLKTANLVEQCKKASGEVESSFHHVNDVSKNLLTISTPQ